MFEFDTPPKTKEKQRNSGSALKCFVIWARRLKCRYDFWRLDAERQRIFRVLEIDPDSKIKRGEI